MNWELLGAVLSGVVSSGLFTWLLQEWIGTRIKGQVEHQYQRKLEEMRNEYAKELATLNSALQETRDFKATRLRAVYDRKVSALCEGFGRLATLEQRLGDYVSLFGDLRGSERDASRKEFAKALGDFESFFVPNRIFFSRQLAEKITNVKNEMNKMALKFMVLAGSPDTPSSQSSPAWNEANDYVQREIPKIRREIEDQIRIELGEPSDHLENSQ